MEDEEDQSKLMYANIEASQNSFQRDYNGDYRWRGRGGRYYGRGRGRGRTYKEFDMSKITCFRCDKLGHFAFACPNCLLKLEEAYETKEEDTHQADRLLMHEVVYLNEKNVKPKEFESGMDGDQI